MFERENKKDVERSGMLMLAVLERKMPKLVVLADVHLHYWSAFSSGRGPEGSRFQRTLRVIADSLDRARALNCPWVCAGDWVHTIGWAHNGVLTHLLQLLRRYEEIEKFTVWGNHDARSYGQAISPEETVVSVLCHGIRNLFLLAGQVQVASNGLSFWGEGFQPSRQFLTLTGREKEVDGLHCDVGVFHQVVSGSRLSNGLVVSNETSGLDYSVLLDLFPLTVVGDVHHPQQFPNGKGRTVLVPGSPEHHNFGDSGDHGWWVCEIERRKDGKHVDCEQIVGGSPRFLTVQTSDQVLADGNFYRVTSPCNKKDLPDNATALTPPPVEVQERSLIQEGSSAADVLRTWLTVDTPPEGESLEEYLRVGVSLLSAEGLPAVRPVRVKRIELKSFLCFSDQDFSFSDGVTLVLGESRDFESNGAGKTSLFEGLFWALFGKTTKGLTSDEVMQWGATECSVCVHLHDQSQDTGVTVRRTRKRGGSVVLEVIIGSVPWSGSPSDLTRDLSRYLGITPDLFQALSYFSQSKLVLFSQATDSERKGMLSDLCGLGVYQQASTSARAQAAECDVSASLLDARLNHERKTLEERQIGLLSLRQKEELYIAECARRETAYREVLQTVESRILVVEAEESRRLAEVEGMYQAQVAAVQQQREQLRQLREEEARQAISRTQSLYAEQIAGVFPEAQRGSEFWRSQITLRTEIRGKVLDERTPIHQEWTRISTEVNVLEQALKKAETLSGECPTCRQQISPEFHRQYTGELRSRISTLQQEGAAQQAILQRLEQKLGEATHSVTDANLLLDKALQFEEITRSRDHALDRVQSSAQRVVEEVENQVRSLVEEANRQKASKVSSIRIQFGSQRSTLEAQKLQAERGLDGLQREQSPYLPLIVETEQHIRTTEDVLQEQAAELARSRTVAQILGYWSRGLSRGGVQSILLESLAAEFNQIRSMIFPLLTRGIYDVQFSTVSATAEGEAREKTAFIIRDRDALVSYEALSGGQRRRIDLGVMLTLSLAVSRRHRTPGVLGILILDEVFGFLDSDGSEALYETLNEIQKLVPAIFAITHDIDLQAMFRQHIVVRQDAHGVSSVVDSSTVETPISS